MNILVACNTGFLRVPTGELIGDAQGPRSGDGLLSASYGVNFLTFLAQLATTLKALNLDNPGGWFLLDLPFSSIFRPQESIAKDPQTTGLF